MHVSQLYFDQTDVSYLQVDCLVRHPFVFMAHFSRSSFRTLIQCNLEEYSRSQSMP